MGLNIKNDRVHELARQAAQVTGKTQTGAIEEALVLLLAERGHDPEAAERRTRIDVATSLSVQWAPETEPKPGAPRDVEDLYDPKTGLPA